MLTPFNDGSGNPSATPPPPGVPGVSASTQYLAQFSGGNTLDNSGMAGDPTTYSASQQKSYPDPYIFMGPAHKITKNTNATVAENDLNTGASKPQGSLLSDLQRQFIDQSAEKKRHWAYLLALTGYAGSANLDPKKAAEFAKTADLSTVLGMHQQFLQDAADQFNIYRRKITPTQLMTEMLKYRLGDKWNGNLNTLTPGTGGGAGSLAGTTTATAKSVDYMSPTDAKGLIRNMLQQQLGRDPTQAEYQDFIATVHGAEAANPQTATKTTTTDAYGNTTNENTTTSGGLTTPGVDQVLYQKARQMPSWAIWQAMGTYAPALYQALDSAVPGS